jgi:hypothetical protein
MTAIAQAARFRCGPMAFPAPAVTAGTRTLAAWVPGTCRMPFPDGMGVLVWDSGPGYGLTTSTGALGTSAQVTITHRVSDPAAFPVITGQLYAGGSPAGSPAVLTPSATYVTETVRAVTGINAGNLASLRLRITWQQQAMGMAYVSWSQARTPVLISSSSGLFLAGII